MVQAMSSTISADDVNILIFAYLQDSGFTHTAFNLRTEAQLTTSTKYKKHVPRGELIELLTKALLYIEVECHYKQDSSTRACTSGFSLLDRHICSSDAPLAPQVPQPVRREKEPKPIPTPRHADDMDVDSHAGPSRNKAEDEKTSKAKQDAVEAKSLMFLPGHNSEVFVTAFNPSQPRVLASGSKDANVKLWDIPDPTETSSVIQPVNPISITSFVKSDQADLTSLHWNSAGTLLAIGSYDSVLRITDLSGSLYLQDSHHSGPIFTVRFSKSGRWLATASLDNSAGLWDVNLRKLVRKYQAHDDCCLDVDWISEDVFATAGADNKINVIRVDLPDPIYSFKGHNNEINQIKCNPSGTRLASCSDDHTTRIWNVEQQTAEPAPSTEAKSVVLKGHTHCVSAVGWCPTTSTGGNELVVTASFDTTSRIWDTVTGDCLMTFEDHKRPIYCLSISPSGDYLATGGGDGLLNVYDLKAKKKTWFWSTGTERPGIFEITWQASKSGKSRFALALECRKVAVMDVDRILHNL